MSKYSLEISKTSLKFLTKSDLQTKEHIIKSIHGIVEDPFHYPGIKQLSGYQSIYRARVGKYRIIYEIIDSKLLILILQIDNRGDIYKHFRMHPLFLTSIILLIF